MQRRMTAPRAIVAGATTAITRRTTLRKAFLAPWHPGVEQAFHYALADAQRRTGVAVHHATLVLTHHHLSVTPERDNLPEFLRLLHHDVSCALNTLLARERYDQPGELFDDRSTHLMRLLDAPAQSTTLLYEHLNVVAAGLVERPEHMPGRCLDFGLWRSGYIEVRRPDFYFSRDRPEVLRLHLTPPPLLLLAFDGDVDKLAYHMQRLATDAARELRAARSRPVLGARRLQRMHPWSEPRTLRETRGKLVPTFRIGARGTAGRELHQQAARETRAFRHSYRQALHAHRAGDRCALFPYGTYQLRLERAVPVAEPPLEGLITRPGPLLCDVRAELEADSARKAATHEPGTPSFAELVDETRAVFHEEASVICEHAGEGMDFDERHVRAATVATSAATRGTAPSEREVVTVRHRFARAREDEHDSSRRIVTLRDRRLGRLPGHRHGADPPR
jgi:hypothetical protein